MSIAPQQRDSSTVYVPASASCLAGFRAWVHSEEFPEQGRISFIRNGVLIDMSPEELETHNKIKTEVTSRIHLLCQQSDMGTLYSDRTLLTNVAAGLSTEPDATFVAWDSFRSNRVRLVPREAHPGEFIELEGSPDWVLEVISRGSVRKDTDLLVSAYYSAGIEEYWLIDALGEEIDFRIMTRGPGAYVVDQSQRGWQVSPVFRRRFRLQRQRDPLGHWRYLLRIKRE